MYHVLLSTLMQRNGHPILVQILLAELCKKRHSHTSPYMRIVQSPQCNIHFFLAETKHPSDFWYWSKWQNHLKMAPKWTWLDVLACSLVAIQNNKSYPCQIQTPPVQCPLTCLSLSPASPISIWLSAGERHKTRWSCWVPSIVSKQYHPPDMNNKNDDGNEQHRTKNNRNNWYSNDK